MISNSVIFLTALMTIWCSFDVAGRYWVQLKKYQNSKNSKSKSLRPDGGSELFSKQPALVMSMSLNTSNQDVPPLFLQQNPTEVCSKDDKIKPILFSFDHNESFIRIFYNHIERCAFEGS